LGSGHRLAHSDHDICAPPRAYRSAGPLTSRPARTRHTSADAWSARPGPSSARPVGTGAGAACTCSCQPGSRGLAIGPGAWLNRVKWRQMTDIHHPARLVSWLKERRAVGAGQSAPEGAGSMSSIENYGILVIGSGEAGKYLAFTMAGEGHRTAVVERIYVGGSCPNIACMPSKNFIHSAKVRWFTMR